MRPTATPAKSKASRRRGVTLVEMLVTVALVLLMMTIIVTIFQSAIGSMHVAQVYQDLDQVLRRLDGTIRQDLRGATARFTPPLNPKLNLGYLEYGENVNADLQGEDTDDYIALTVKAPIGQPFRGRMWAKLTATNPNYSIQPVEITSDFAEVIYFLRNGNLYRRVLLIAPDKQHMISPGTGSPFNFFWPLYNGLPVSWIGMNDLSARPAETRTDTNGPGINGGSYLPILNTLGDLTNRENRYSRPRFANDYVNNLDGSIGPDGLPDDQNLNGIPDYYPTLYPNALGLLNETRPGRHATLDSLAFPFIYPGMYSQPSLNSPDNSIGLMHGLDPTTYNVNPLAINHSPLLTGQGDNLPGPGGAQTWWGFPTWRETMSPRWWDPIWRLNDNSNGNNPNATRAPGMSWVNITPLPPMNSAVIPNTVTPYRLNPQQFCDGIGSPVFAAETAGQPDALWLNTWENDLIATGVRSFDIKAFDPTVKAYVDLGYGAEQNTTFLAQTPPASLYTFAHEGRMPPKSSDYRVDPQWPGLTPIGDDNASTIRLRRVWDSWSTAYTNAPDIPLDPTAGPPFTRPVYPSYPPPYPAPLRGIQIQIRLVNDPKAERVKVLTIRQDFTDKL
ncbi:MAG: hypothetical protein NVSMB14_02620 [Isosphaeraceae bacterium]